MDFLHEISKKQFIADYEKCKKFVDLGVKEYFVLLNNSAISGVHEIGNTTLNDICDVFGEEYVYMFNFADYYDCGRGDRDPESVHTFRFRKLRKTDKSKLRNDYRYFPDDCWVCEWKDATGYGVLVPFIQAKDASVHFLADNPVLNKNFSSKNKDFVSTRTSVGLEIKHIIEHFPEYADCLFAMTEYKNTQMLIPIEAKSAKKTFKARDKDETGVKRHLVHNVSSHSRKTLKNADSVEAHLRGRSDFTMDGIDVSLICGWEMTKRELARKRILT